MVIETADTNANIIFGSVVDNSMGDEVRVTVIATGFDGGMPKRRSDGNVLRQNQPAQTQEQTRAAAQQLATKAPAPTPVQSPSQSTPTTFAPSSPDAQPVAGAPRPARQVQFDDDELDVPDFLK